MRRLSEIGKASRFANRTLGGKRQVPSFRGGAAEPGTDGLPSVGARRETLRERRYLLTRGGALGCAEWWCHTVVAVLRLADRVRLFGRAAG
jgi:hypothetical protein